MHIDLTTLQMKITKEQSISTDLQRLLRPFPRRDVRPGVYETQAIVNLQGPSLKIESM